MAFDHEYSILGFSDKPGFFDVRDKTTDELKTDELKQVSYNFLSHFQEILTKPEDMQTSLKYAKEPAGIKGEGPNRFIHPAQSQAKLTIDFIEEHSLWSGLCRIKPGDGTNP